MVPLQERTLHGNTADVSLSRSEDQSASSDWSFVHRRPSTSICVGGVLRNMQGLSKAQQKLTKKPITFTIPLLISICRLESSLLRTFRSMKVKHMLQAYSLL
ncbi:hypothetical protein AMTR_s00104p00077710 [Amborella trichopoda]|uniref:Uncharacterized protein n=1 Tax=Amborella trichopoda TaxID=13333 RepID=W1NYA6_AMBTC|nr:hypothetical protein AMTR_s00104p00077710 [Amborella trichopoda]